MRRFLKSAFFLSFIFLSCNYSRSYINDPKDHQKGIHFLDDFYQKIKLQKSDEIDALTSDTLRTLSGPNGLSKLTKIVFDKIGNYKRHKIKDYKIVRTNGKINQCVFKYKLEVSYENGTVEELIGFKIVNDNNIKIISYNIYSDLLVK